MTPDHFSPQTPRKASEAADESGLCTPLKALKEAVRLATPSPVKHVFRKSVPNTPGKWLNGQAAGSSVTPVRHSVTPMKGLSWQAATFTPSPCKRPPTTPAKW
jgi:hypothetical protein